MSRNRKLYVSELLKRNTNKNLKVCIKTQFAYHYWDSIEACIRQQDFLDEQVIKWKIDILRNQLTIETWTGD